MSASGMSAPSSPDSPWISLQTSTAGRINGRFAPIAIGMSERPARRAMRSAFDVTFSIVWLPATVVRAMIFTAGDPAARMIAAASSYPGSQSRMIFLGSVIVFSFN